MDFPVNDRFIRFDNELAYASIPDSISLSGGNRLRVTIDCFFDTLPAAGAVIFAGKSATADWQMELAGTGIVSFTVRRSGGDNVAALSAAQACVAGRRVILEGIDTGATVKLYKNGVVGATSVASATGGIVSDAVDLWIGANNSRLGLFAFEVQRDDITVVRLYVREEAGVILHDTSFYGNHAAISGTEDEHFMYGTDTSFEAVFPGSSLL